MEPSTVPAAYPAPVPPPSVPPPGDTHLFVLHEAVQAIARQTDARDTLTFLAEKARGLTGAASVAFTLLDPTRTLLDFTAVAGADADQIIGQSVRAEDALAGQTALTGEIYLAHHAGQMRPLLAALEPDLSQGWGVRSAVVVPLYRQGRTQGALTAINRNGDGAFSPADVVTLQLLANLGALALGSDDLKRQVAQKQRERDILFDAVRTTSSSLNVQEVLQNVLATVAGTLEMTAGAVFLLNDERTRLYIGADEGLGEDNRDRQLPTDGTGPAARALSSGQPLLLADASPEDGADGDWPLPEMRSLLLAPMVARASPEGLIVVGSRQAGAFTQDDARLLSAVASQAAVALENAWLYEDATRRAQEATALYELSQAVGATLQLDRVLHFVADSVLALLHVDKFALFLLSPHREMLEIKIARNISRECVAAMKPRLGEGIAGWVAEFETPTAVQDVAADHRNRSCPMDGEGVRSLVSVPLQSGDQVIGVLHAMSSRRRLFTVGEMELLYTIANQVGAAIANAQMYEEARQQSDEIRKGVRRVARALGSSRSLPQTAQSIADLATETTDTDRSVLYLSDDSGRLLVRAAANVRAPALGQPDTRSPESPAQWIARRGRSLAIGNLAQDTRFSLPAFAARDRVAGYLGVPLKLGPETLGVLEVYTREARRFTPDEVRLFLVFASQASVALQNSLLIEQAGRRLSDLKALRAVSEILQSSPSSDALLPPVLTLLAEATHADAAALAAPNQPLALWQRAEAADKGGADTLARLAAGARREAQHLGSSDEYGAALVAPMPGAGGDAPPGAAVLLRAGPETPFDVNDRYLVMTVLNLLAARFTAPFGTI